MEDEEEVLSLGMLPLVAASLESGSKCKMVTGNLVAIVVVEILQLQNPLLHRPLYQ
jgi:thiamine transporter ThiT